MSRQTQCPPSKSFPCPRLQEYRRANGRSQNFRDTIDADEYDHMRNNEHGSDRPYRSNEQYDTSFHLNVDAKTLNALNSLRSKACRFLRSDPEEIGTEYSDYRPPYSFESQSRNEGGCVRRARDIDYVPESEFLRKMKQQCEFLKENQPNVFSFLDEVDLNEIYSSEFQKFSDKSYNSSRFEEQPDSYPPPVDYSDANVILEENVDNRKTDRGTSYTKIIGEGEKPVATSSPYQYYTQKSQPPQPPPAGDKCTCDKCENLKCLLQEVKTEHVSRSKKRDFERKERKRKPGESCKSGSEKFEPNLKRPHEDSCERCWRYASPSRSPVNKPEQKYDPNFRRGHSCITLAKGEDIDAFGRHINPCKVQPTVAGSKPRPKSSSAEPPSQKYTLPVPQQYAQPKPDGMQFPQGLHSQPKSSGMQYPPRVFDQQTYTTMPPPSSQQTASHCPYSCLAEKYSPTPPPNQFYSRKYQLQQPPPQQPPPQQQWCPQKYASTPAPPPPPHQYISGQYSTIPHPQQYTTQKPSYNPPPTQQYTTQKPSYNPPPTQQYTTQKPSYNPPPTQQYSSPIPPSSTPYKIPPVQHHPPEQSSSSGKNTDTSQSDEYSQSKFSRQNASKRQDSLKSHEKHVSRPQTAETSKRHNSREMNISDAGHRPKNCVPDMAPAPGNLHRFPGIEELDATEYLPIQSKPKESPCAKLSSSSKANKTYPSSGEAENPCNNKISGGGALKTIPEGSCSSMSETQSPKSKSGKTPRRRGSAKTDSATKSSTKSGGKKSKSKSPSPKGAGKAKSPKSSPKDTTSTRRVSFEEDMSLPCPKPPDTTFSDYYRLLNEPARTLSQQYDSPHPIRECVCPPRLANCCNEIDPGEHILCCHCDWQTRLKNKPAGSLLNTRIDLENLAPDASHRNGRERSFQGRTYRCPYRRYANACVGLPEPQSSTFGSLPKNLNDYQLPPPTQDNVLPRGCTPPRKYVVMYMTEFRDKKGDDIEVLIEELAQGPPGETDKRTKDITEKMKKIMECPSDSMALRFQKGVAEACRIPKSSRTLYF